MKEKSKGGGAGACGTSAEAHAVAKVLGLRAHAALAVPAPAWNRVGAPVATARHGRLLPTVRLAPPAPCAPPALASSVARLFPPPPSQHPPSGSWYWSLPSDPEPLLRHTFGPIFMCTPFDAAVESYGAVLSARGTHAPYGGGGGGGCCEERAAALYATTATELAVTERAHARHGLPWAPSWWQGHSPAHTIVGALVSRLYALDTALAAASTRPTLSLALALYLDAHLPLVYLVAARGTAEACTDRALRCDEGVLLDAWPCMDHPAAPTHAWGLPDISHLLAPTATMAVETLEIPLAPGECGECGAAPPAPPATECAARILCAALPGPSAGMHIYKTLAGLVARMDATAWYILLPWLRGTVLCSLVGNYPRDTARAPLVERIRLSNMLLPSSCATGAFMTWAAAHEGVLMHALVEALDFALQLNPGARAWYTTYLAWEPWSATATARLDTMRRRARVLARGGCAPTYALPLIPRARVGFLPHYPIARYELIRNACGKQAMRKALHASAEHGEALRALFLRTRALAMSSPAITFADVTALLHSFGATPGDIATVRSLMEDTTMTRARAHALVAQMTPIAAVAFDTIRAGCRMPRTLVTQLPEAIAARQQHELCARYMPSVLSAAGCGSGGGGDAGAASDTAAAAARAAAALSAFLTKVYYCTSCMRVCTEVEDPRESLAAVQLAACYSRRGAGSRGSAAHGAATAASALPQPTPPAAHVFPGVWRSATKIARELCDSCGGDGCSDCAFIGATLVCMWPIDSLYASHRAPCRGIVRSVDMYGQIVFLLGTPYMVCPGASCGRIFVVREGALLCTICALLEKEAAGGSAEGDLHAIPDIARHASLARCAQCGARADRPSLRGSIFRVVDDDSGHMRCVALCATHARAVPGGVSVYSESRLCAHLVRTQEHRRGAHGTRPVMLHNDPPRTLQGAMRAACNFPTGL